MIVCPTPRSNQGAIASLSLFTYLFETPALYLIRFYASPSNNTFLRPYVLGSENAKESNERRSSDVDNLGGADLILENLLMQMSNLKHSDYKHAGGASSPTGVPWRLFVIHPMQRSFKHLHTVKITIRSLSLRYLETTQYIDSPSALYDVPVGSSNVQTLKLKESFFCSPNLASFVAGCRKLRTLMYEHSLPTPHEVFNSEPALDLRVLEPALRRHRDSLRNLIITTLARDTDSCGHFSTLQDFRVLNSVVCPADWLQRPQEETSVMIRRFGSLFPASMKRLMVTIDTTSPDFDWTWSPCTLKPHSCLSHSPGSSATPVNYASLTQVDSPDRAPTMASRPDNLYESKHEALRATRGCQRRRNIRISK
ncbi:hypothetical protein FB567DRAFT_610653 [Paraphoma chrysanthemicola]|uniref:Uncharacterized protein n=1 Tax=Paraphoma chrysanthemicola TaxID=798071 RepID=A0A8K0QVL9_9PLEO|nr:hypothetical protein FB567DRAFT_610653 [Paraphoma chrysanthemicola]